MRIITDSQYMKQRIDKIIMIVDNTYILVDEDYHRFPIHETEIRQNNYDCI